MDISPADSSERLAACTTFESFAFAISSQYDISDMLLRPIIASGSRSAGTDSPPMESSSLTSESGLTAEAASECSEFTTGCSDSETLRGSTRLSPSCDVENFSGRVSSPASWFSPEAFSGEASGADSPEPGTVSGAVGDASDDTPKKVSAK